MNAPYRPQDHAVALAEQIGVLAYLQSELAALRGDVARLVRALPSEQLAGADDAAFTDLVRAIFGAMGTATWICSDLMTRTIDRDDPALQLLAAMAATGRAGTPRSLGRYLATNVPGDARVTADGLEIRRSGFDGNTLAWTVAEV
jgi:hypothetical protein